MMLENTDMMQKISMMMVHEPIVFDFSGSGRLLVLSNLKISLRDSTKIKMKMHVGPSVNAEANMVT